MKSNSYLYGTDDVPPIPVEVCDERIELLMAHRDKLQSVKREHRAYMQLNAVVSAISFWDSLKKGKTL